MYYHTKPDQLNSVKQTPIGRTWNPISISSKVFGFSKGDDSKRPFLQAASWVHSAFNLRLCLDPESVEGCIKQKENFRNSKNQSWLNVVWTINNIKLLYQVCTMWVGEKGSWCSPLELKDRDCELPRTSHNLVDQKYGCKLACSEGSCNTFHWYCGAETENYYPLKQVAHCRDSSAGGSSFAGAVRVP